MSLQAVYEASTDTTFQGRCVVATWIAAQAILAENPQTPKHAQRKDWATTILRSTQKITPQVLAIQVLQNPSIAANPTLASDGDIQFQVNSIIDTLIAIG